MIEAIKRIQREYNKKKETLRKLEKFYQDQ